MPDKPVWYARLGEIRECIEALPGEWIDRATVETVLGVGRRRAQQILRTCGAQRAGGSSFVAGRQEFLAAIDALASGEAAAYENARRIRLARRLAAMDRDLRTQPKVLVEAPAAVASTRLASLPRGITVEPGRIVVTFSSPEEALERLLALAMAIGNDLPAFDHIAAADPQHK